MQAKLHAEAQQRAAQVAAELAQATREREGLATRLAASTAEVERLSGELEGASTQLASAEGARVGGVHVQILFLHYYVGCSIFGCGAGGAGG